VAVAGLLPSRVDAGGVALKFGGAGVYPQLATANSQRWFRVNVTWDTGTTTFEKPTGVPHTVVNERIKSIRLVSGNVAYNPGYGGASGNFFSTDGPYEYNPAAVATPHSNGTNVGVIVNYHANDGNVDITIGPFSGYNYDNLVGSVRTGRMASGAGGADISFPFRFDLTTEKWDNGDAKTYATPVTISTPTVNYQTIPLSQVTTPGSGVGDSGEIMYWYSSDGHDVSPLTVTTNNPAYPVRGSSASEYIFRVVYWRFGTTPPAHWRATPTDPDTGAGLLMPAEGDSFARFDAYAYKVLATGIHDDSQKTTASDGNYGVHGHDPWRNWLFGIGDPHMDWVGSHEAWNSEGGVLDPELIMIMDNDFSKPYYMRREQLLYNGKTYENVYRYDMIPTNYMQALHNIWRFPYDLTGSDPWDGFTQNMQGLPVTNTYNALTPGTHSYQFIATRDWDPPVGKIVDDNTGQTHIGRQVVAMFGQPGEQLGAAFLVRDGAYGTTDDRPAPSTGIGCQRIGYYFPGREAGYGYPYDARVFPKVNPGLSAFPYVPMGLDNIGAFGTIAGTYPNSLPNPFQQAFPSTPWDPIVGPQPVQMWYTNDDTISPNLFNIDPGDYQLAKASDLYDYSKRAAFRGGKWTTDSNYVFRINYWQSENRAPQSAQIFIRKTDAAGTPTSGWIAHSMQKVDSSNTNYANGVVYYYQASAASLPNGGGAGDYNYYFAFSDGTNTAIFPNRPGFKSNGGVFPDQPNDWGMPGVPGGDNDWYWFRVNHKPVLVSSTVTPGSGAQGSSFVFGANYSDQDGMVRSAGHRGDQPYKSTLWIDLFGDVQGQMRVVSVTDKTVTYDFVPASIGKHMPYEAGSLASLQNGRQMKVSFQTGAAANKEYQITGNAVVTPGADGTGTIDLFSAPAGVMAGDLLQVVNWFPTTMYLQTEADPITLDFTKGIQYAFDTARAGMVLDPGMHNYYFEFWDNWGYWPNWEQYFPGTTPAGFKVEGEMTRLPAVAGSYFSGPFVQGNRPPSLAAFYAEPPAAETATKVVNGTTLLYLRPLGKPLYADGSLVGKFLVFATGLAAGRVYQVDNNVAGTLTVHKVSGAGGLIADRVTLGDTFRIFNGWTAAKGLSGYYHVTPDPLTRAGYDGTPATPFTLHVTYSDPDNNPPATLRVAVYSSAGQAPSTPDAFYDMVPTDPSQTNYVAGVDYKSAAPVNLSAGSHWFRAQAFDGNDWFAGGSTGKDWFGPALTTGTSIFGPVVIENHPPNPPTSGFAPANRASVNTANPTLRWDPASDPDPGDSVVAYTVQLSKNGFAGGAVDYQYSTTSNTVGVADALTDLTLWSWRVQSQDTLGAVSVWSAVQEFNVDLKKAPPTLTPPGGVATATLTPQTGDLSTDFVYRIVYANADGLAPASGIYVEIDGNLYPTQLTAAGGTPDYVAGVTYSITIRGDSPVLGYGRHTYRFYAGAVSWPAGSEGAQAGPWIDDPSTTMIANAAWTQINQVEEGSTLYLQVVDPDKKGAGTVQVVLTVAAGGDTERVTLVETGPATGIFRGTIPTKGTAGLPNDGTLNVSGGPTGTQVTATYTDPDTADAPPAGQDSSSAQVLVVDTVAPAKVQPYLTVTSDPQGVGIQLDWSTYPVPADLAGYHVWLSDTQFTSVSGLTALATVAADKTSYAITGLTPNHTYYVAVTAFDEVPNEDKLVRGKSIFTKDTSGPTVSSQQPAPDAIDVPLATTISFNLNDTSGVKPETIQLFVNGISVTSKITRLPASGTPQTVAVSYSGNFNWNQTVTVRTLAKDVLGNQSDTTWQFHTVGDLLAPAVTNLNPAQGATGISSTATLSFHLQDAVSGIKLSTLRVTVNGTDVSGRLTVNSANLNDVIVSYQDPNGLPSAQQIAVVINASDRAGNAMAPFTWTFNTLAAISGRVTSAGGVATPGVTVTNGVVSAVTGADGRYVLLGVADGTYTVVPTLQYWAFTPVNRIVTVAGATVTGIDFEAAPQTYAVSGLINNASGDPLAGVQVSDGTHTTTTDVNGHYVLAGILAGQVTITPTSAQYSFLPASTTITVPTSTSVDFTGYQSFKTTMPAGLSMIGVPYDPVNRDAVSVFGTPGISRWNPIASPPGYVRPTDPNSASTLEVRPGKGYFVQYSRPFALSGFGLPVSTAVPFAISLGPNWNMIANPFPMALPMANLAPALPGGVDPYAFVYDHATGSYLFVSSQPGANVARTYLLPWEGAWLRSLIGTTSVSATAPTGALSATTGVAPQALSVGTGGYILPIVAKVGGRADLCSAAGVSANGSFEIPNPPTVSGGVDLYFVNDAGESLAQQVKTSAAPQVWEFVVSTDLARSQVAVSLPDLSQVPNDRSVILTDEDAGRAMYMRTTPQYVFTSGAKGAVRHFRLEVVARGGNNLAIASTSAQQVGAGGVVVTYSVTQPCQVDLEVVNIAGRVIRHLANGQVSPTGVSTQSWNLRGEDGASVPAGLYLVRVHAVAENGQRVDAVTQVSVTR
jgi:hypothetical protein